MRLETKIAAAVVGVVVVGAGAWYLFSGGDQAKDEGSAQVDATKAASPDQAKPEVTPSASSTNKPGISPVRTSGPLARNEGSGSPVSIRPPDRAAEGNRPLPMTTFETPRDTGLSSPRTGLGNPPGVTANPALPRPSWADQPSARPTDFGPKPLGDNRLVSTPGQGLSGSYGMDRRVATRPSFGGSPPGTVTSVTMASGSHMGLSTATRPATVTPMLGGGPSGATKTHVIQAGDTFSSLAAKYLGGAKHIKIIMDANPDLDPRRLRLGATVKIPPAPAGSTVSTPSPSGTVTGGPSIASRGPLPSSGPPTVRSTTPTVRPSAIPTTPGAQTYTVQPGEGWYTLAQRFLGKGTRWTELYEHNKERVGGSSRSLRVGTVIEIPPESSSGTP